MYLCTTPVRVPSMDGLTKRARRTRTHAAFAHRQRPHAIARARKNTHAYPFTYPDFALIYIYMYIVHDVCVGYIYRRTYPRAHVMATAATSALAIARTCAWEAVQPHARPYPSLTQVHTYIYVYIIFNTNIYVHTIIYPVFATRSYTYTRRHPRMRVPKIAAHTRARAHRRRTPPRVRSACGGAPPGPERAAHTYSNVVTRAVFHAPMFALNANAAKFDD